MFDLDIQQQYNVIAKYKRKYKCKEMVKTPSRNDRNRILHSR